MESQVSRLAKFILGKSMDLQNFYQESQQTYQILIRKSMRVTCIIILIILQETHKVLHILYHVVHIIISYSIRPWNHVLDIRTSLNKGSTYATSTRSLHQKTQSLLHSFVRTSFSFVHILVQSLVIPRMYFKTLIGFAVQ